MKDKKPLTKEERKTFEKLTEYQGESFLALREPAFIARLLSAETYWRELVKAHPERESRDYCCFCSCAYDKPHFDGCAWKLAQE